MMKLMDNRTLSATATILFLLILTISNAVWLILNWRGGALIALAFYLVVSLIILTKQHFQAGVMAGSIGFGIHLLELFGMGASQLTGIDQIFFYVNLILPVPLAITSFLAARKESIRQSDQNNP